MKKIKQFSLKAMLLTILAALTIGFTGCSDELSGDQTQGKPGYLTINLKTLKPNQTKLTGAHGTDYNKISTMDIFVFNAGGQVLIHKFSTPNATGGTALLDISVNQLDGTEYVVVVANYDGPNTGVNGMTGIVDIGDLNAVEINTVQDFNDAASKGLHMTGKANIETTATGYISNVNVAPVEAKITVNWAFGTTELSDNFKVTGIYVVNAITKTTLPIIRDRVYNGTTWAASASNILPKDYINLSGTANRTAATGFVIPVAQTTSDFNLYDGLTAANNLLKDEDAAGLIQTANTYHYYVGENYSNNVVPTVNSLLADITIPHDATAKHANTIVIIKATPTTAGALIYGAADRYYTYEFDKMSNPINRYGDATNPNIITGGQIAPTTATEVGLSIRRKTDYKLTFNLNSVGATEPFRRIRTLRVNVQAEGWDDGTTSANF